MGELDLIAKDAGYLVFVEVKYRTDSRAGGALAAVGREKQRVISKVARYYLMTHYGSIDVACRFDVIGFDETGICWIENAFDYCT